MRKSGCSSSQYSFSPITLHCCSSSAEWFGALDSSMDEVEVSSSFKLSCDLFGSLAAVDGGMNLVGEEGQPIADLVPNEESLNVLEGNIQSSGTSKQYKLVSLQASSIEGNEPNIVIEGNGNLIKNLNSVHVGNNIHSNSIADSCGSVFSAHSTSGRIGTPWKRRNCVYQGPSSREQMNGTQSALQKALMKFANRETNYIIDPKIGTEFGCCNEAYEYYNLYPWECGFGIRWGTSRYSMSRKCYSLPEDDRYQLSQEFYCSCHDILNRVAMSLLQADSEVRRCSNHLHEGHSSSLQSEVVMLRRKVVDLEAAQAAQNLAASKRSSDLEDELACTRADLHQVTAFLDSAREANSSLQWKFDVEKRNHEGEVQRLEAEISRQEEENRVLSTSRDNLDRLYKGAVSDLTTLQNSHNLTMTELDHKRNELSLLQESVDELHESLSSKDSAIKGLRALSKSQAKKMEVLEHNVSVLKNDYELLKTSHDKAMGKVIRAGRLLMKKLGVVVLEDIAADVQSAPGADARIPPSESGSASAAKSETA